MPAKKDDRQWVEEHYQALRQDAERVAHIHPDVLEPVKPWSILKQIAVRNILGMYLGVMARQEWAKTRTFIDTNSSCGVNLLEATQHRVAGSSLIGASSDTPFTQYHFIEPDRVKREALEARLAVVLRGRTYEVHGAPADDALPRIMKRVPRYDAHYFAVVDPYRLSDITWKGLSALMAHPRGDVLINFQTTQVKRGTKEIAEAFFGTAKVSDLIDQDASEDLLLKCFLDQVHAVRPMTETLRVRSGKTRYYYDIIYATAQTRGGNPWLANAVGPLRQRLERITGEDVLAMLQSESLDRFF